MINTFSILTVLSFTLSQYIVFGSLELSLPQLNCDVSLWPSWYRAAVQVQETLKEKFYWYDG